MASRRASRHVADHARQPVPEVSARSLTSRGRLHTLRVHVHGSEHSLVHAVAAELRRAFPEVPVSNADARRVVMAGAARVNGQVIARPGAPVRAGDRIAITADLSRLARMRRPARLKQTVAILYQDEHVVAVDKPAGLPTHATADPRRPHLVALVARQLGVPEPALAVHQRLDAGTSGVVLFGRGPEANRQLARAFALRAVEKVYLALVDSGERPDLRTGDTWIARESLALTGTGRKGRRVRVSSVGEAAETMFVVRERQRNRALVEARPKTGRQHQIRAHLSAARLPIVGDTRHGGPAAERLHLHAWRLELAHPVTGLPLRIESPAPEAWLSSV